jgi:hypothetical protein
MIGLPRSSVEKTRGGQRASRVRWRADLDSGRYAPSEIDGQSIADGGLPGWDWIRPSQIEWYSANTGFGTYGLDGPEKDRMRGARVFVIDEADPERFETYMVRASDYGI